MERRALIVRGIVQGVGFRPYVYRLARQCQLSGSVRNLSGSVRIEVEGESSSLARFCQELVDRPPPLAAVDEVSCWVLPLGGEREFQIVESIDQQDEDVLISPDIATCDDCLRELFDPSDRRFRYPFLNCTNCGPRLTIVRGAPYDRRRTTMAAFGMCQTCRAEYENPANRRYHAQPTCCAKCGPLLQLFTASRQPITSSDLVATFANEILAGKIGALKGLGGYHLVCDGSNDAAVSRLRGRKHRQEKPFAIMAASIEPAQQWCEINSFERDLLTSRARPIVLLQKKQGATALAGAGRQIAEAVAPANPTLGVMLPYTPLHHLLAHAARGAPLVMTSGNRSDEPIAYEDHDAFEQLGAIAEVFLIHDRAIHVRCDDSVTRAIDGRELPVRRSRGHAPRPIDLPGQCAAPILAVGGQLKSTFSLARGNKAILSHHLGDLDDFRAYQAFERDILLYERLFEIRPRLIVHDLHPDYASTSYARRRASVERLDIVAVQHHHAHVAACMAEHRLQGDVIGVAFDGTGYGSDGAIWGGEFLVAGYSSFRRAAHLRYVPLPGGDQAIREPWRSAATHCLEAGCDLDRLLSPKPERRTVRQMIERRVNSPPTSSVGRLFDAVAALLGIRDRVGYEGQAAMELEWLAASEREAGSYPFETSAPTAASPPDCLEIDTRPLIRAVADDIRACIERPRIARRFHSTIVELMARVCTQIRSQTGLDRVVLSGGVFLNLLLAREATARLSGEGFAVFSHQRVPPGDGGISLGQCAVAAAQLAAAQLAGADCVSPELIQMDRPPAAPAFPH